MGRPASASAHLRQRRAAPAPAAASRTGPRHRHRADDRGRQPRRPVRPLRDPAAAPHRITPGRVPRPRARLRRRLWANRHLAACPARQARHRTRRPARHRHRSRARRLGPAPRPATPAPAPPHRQAHRLPVRRTRSPAQRLADPRGPTHRRHSSWTGRAKRADARGDPTPAAAHLRHRTGQRRNEPASSHGHPRTLCG